jgi:hypothetical protein
LLILIVVLLIPLMMIGIGTFFAKKAPPAKINFIYGYRTRMSMKNKDMWAFAHKHWGKTWRNVGLIMLPFSVCTMAFAIGKEAADVNIFGGLIVGVQLVVLIASIIPTELALRKNFDNQGNRKKQVHTQP